jgi:glycosyltransferase involved in cell wall biosynthesis
MPAVTLLIADLGPGGAQRVLTWLANRWADRGREVSLWTLDDGRTPPHHPLDDRVRLRALGLARPSTGAVDGAVAAARRIRALRDALARGRPGPVVAFVDTTNVVAAIAAAASGRAVVVSERIDPHEHRIGPVWSAVRPWAYRLADRIVVQTERAGAYFGPSLASRIVRIPNPVHARATTTGNGGGGLVAMGRLDRQKGFDLLLEAFARVAASRSNVRLTIWGEGPERPALEAQRDRLGLHDTVRLPGVTRDPEAAIRAADAFVLSSRYEGFPNVLCEALATGVPTVAFDCAAGPDEILDDGRAGLLVPPGDVPALAEAIARLLDDPALGADLARRGLDAVRRYDPETVGRAWDAVVDRLSVGRAVDRAGQPEP